MTKQQLREAIRRIIRKELNEGMPSSAKRAFEKDIVTDPDYIDLKNKIKDRFFNYQKSGDFTGEVPNVAKRDHYVDRFKDIESDFEDDDELSENAPAKPTTKPGVKEPPAKTPDKKEPRRPLGNPNVKPQPKAKTKATVKEAEMLKQVIKRFKSKK
jgi:hypothetical protein